MLGAGSLCRDGTAPKPYQVLLTAPALTPSSRALPPHNQMTWPPLPSSFGAANPYVWPSCVSGTLMAIAASQTLSRAAQSSHLRVRLRALRGQQQGQC